MLDTSESGNRLLISTGMEETDVERLISINSWKEYCICMSFSIIVVLAVTG
ncbi:hypothetical protein SDC9_177728 [bioreactor metagenome]|uniref:Uncharacterized protein n=1 Tax=bioreactor metagenome TaxID=1076179 RepID=A0A645GU22_9ZZZZ